MKPKLLVLTSTFPRWQNDTDPPFVYELSRRLTNTFDITVHTPHYPGARTREKMDGMDINRFRYFFAPLEKLAGSTGILPTLHHNKLYYGLVPFFLLAQFFSLLLLVRKEHPDVIHAHWIIPQGFIAALVRALSGTPVIVTAHGADIFGLQGALFKTIKRFTVTRVQAITVVSQALSSVLSDLSSSGIPTKIISMGVDSEVFHPDRKNDFIREKYAVNGPLLLYVGRLTEKKGVGFLIDAMPKVLSEIPDAKLLIVGSGELENELHKKAVHLSLNDHVRFAGSVSNIDLPKYYTAADVFVGPSIETRKGDTEGFGLTFVEAAMSGCLVIGTTAGGIGDIVEDGVTGFLVPEKDSEALADKIVYGLKHKEEAEKIQELARESMVTKYDWVVIVRRYATILQQVLLGI